MQVTVEYLGQLGHLAEREQESHEVPEDQDLIALLRAIADRYGETFNEIVFDEAGVPRASLMILINDAPVEKTRPPAMHSGDRVTLLAAIAGG